jgi:hypothetical protein
MGSTLRLEQPSALDLLADALRRADASWHADQIDEWEDLDESERDRWRDLARIAATAVHDELSADRHRVTAR